MNNYLHSLPFQKDANRLSACICPTQGFDPPSFKLYTEADRLPTFCLRLPKLDVENPDLSYANECVRIKTCDGTTVASVTMEQSGAQLYKDGVSYYLVYDGSKIEGIKLECGQCYRLKYVGCYSEVFWVTATPSEKVRLEFSNKGQLGDVPYQITDFVQKLLIDGEICSLEDSKVEDRKTESNGKETISFQRTTLRKGLSVYGAPDFVAQLISAASLHDTFKVFNKNEEYDVLKKRSTVDATQNGCCDYDVEAVLPLRDIDIIGGNCQTDTDPELIHVEIPDDLPDSCAIDDDFDPTDETICLKIGEVPPVIDPPIVVVPPTPPTTCPPSGFVIGSQTFKQDCNNPFIVLGIRYTRKVTEIRANGNCGNTTIDLFYDTCPDVSQSEGSVQALSIECEGNQVDPVETTVKPAGLNRVAFTHDVDTNEFSMYLNVVGGASVRLVAETTPQPFGVSSDGLIWDDGTYLPGTTAFGTVEFPRTYRFNPNSPGVGGISRAKSYTAYIKLDSNPLVVFKKTFKTGNVSNTQTKIDISLTPDGLANCDKGPFLLTGSATQTKFTGSFDGNGVDRFFFGVQNGSSTLVKIEMVWFPKATESDIVENAKPTKLVQFFTGAAFEVIVPELPTSGGLSVTIQGSSCNSQPSSLPITVSVAALAFESGYPRYTSVSGINTALLRLTTASTQLVVVKNTATNALIYNASYSFVPGSSLTLNNVPFGTYLVTIGTLTYTLQVLAPVSGGNVVAKVLSHSLPFHINIEITGSDKRWLFKDKAGYNKPAGTKFLYKIAGDHFITDTEIDGYVYNSNTPVRILKGIIKDGYVGLWQWADDNGITLNDDVSPGFSYNNSTAQTSIAFIGGSLDGFINMIPNWLNPDVGNCQFMDEATAFTMPYGHAHLIRRGTYSIAQILAKGATHIANGQLDWGAPDLATVIPAQRNAGITYSDVPLNNVTWSLTRNESIPNIFISNPPGQSWPYIYNQQFWPNGALDEATSRYKAHISAMNDNALHVGEAEEGDPAISSHWPMWNWLYDESRIIRKSKWDDLGITSYMCHNYYHIGYPDMMSLGKMTEATQKAAINRPVSEWTPCGFEPGGNLQWTDSVAHGLYLGAPDKDSTIYSMVFLIGIMKILGKKSIAFAFLTHEWRPNNHTNVNYPDGVFYQAGKVPFDPADVFNFSYLLHVHSGIGGATIEWGGAEKSSTRDIYAPYSSSPMFFPTGSNEQAPMPHFGAQGYYPYNGLADIWNIGAKSYADNWAVVDGGTEAYLEFRLDGSGAWITASNVGLDDIIAAHYQHRGYVFSRRKSGIIIYYYLDKWGAGTEHTIEIKNPVNPAEIWTGKVSSNMALTQTKNY